jgi:hypothetical protein
MDFTASRFLDKADAEIARISVYEDDATLKENTTSELVKSVYLLSSISSSHNIFGRFKRTVLRQCEDGTYQSWETFKINLTVAFRHSSKLTKLLNDYEVLNIGSSKK